MKATNKKSIYWLIGLVLVIIFAVVMAYLVRSDFGKTEVTYIKIPEAGGGIVTARLYRPIYATANNKLPGVLVMHGGNNDKDTAAPVAIELSRRGFVVLAPDLDGHGDNSGSWDLAAMMAGKTFLGADVAYDYLKTLPYVDASQIGATGHSLGGMMATALGMTRPKFVPLCRKQNVVPRIFPNYTTIYVFNLDGNLYLVVGAMMRVSGLLLFINNMVLLNRSRRTTFMGILQMALHS